MKFGVDIYHIILGFVRLFKDIILAANAHLDIILPHLLEINEAFPFFTDKLEILCESQAYILCEIVINILNESIFLGNNICLR